MKKRLTLTRESIAPLSADELAGAVAGVTVPTFCLGFTCPVQHCLTNRDDCGNITYNC
jgi:hypothetical protein